MLRFCLTQNIYVHCIQPINRYSFDGDIITIIIIIIITLRRRYGTSRPKKNKTVQKLLSGEEGRGLQVSDFTYIYDYCFTRV